MFHRILFVVSTLVYQVSWSIVCTVDWENMSPTLQIQPSCPFDALCTCSGTGPILGVVQCLDTPLDAVPNLNSSKVFILRLENNGIRVLDESRFANTGMWRLQMRHNPITRIPDGTFNGLKHSLQELDLRHNRLHFFPRAAVSLLYRLEEMDLTGNQIMSVERTDFVGLERSLKKLVLRCNLITSLEQDTFTNLVALEWLDLSENRLSFVSQTSFDQGSSMLRHLNLADNALSVIPYGVLALLKSLRHVDLSRNQISSVTTITDSGDGIDSTVTAALLQMAGGLKLESLLLDENQIETISQKNFRHFTTIKRLSLQGNPLKIVRDDAFLGTIIEELNMRGCDLQSISCNAFAGLKETLRHVDLAHNLLNGSNVGDAMANMTSLVNVSLNGNVRSIFDLQRVMSDSANSLQELHLESADAAVGKSNAVKYGFELASFEELTEFIKLRTFGISHFQDPILKHLNPTAETIILKNSNLRTLDRNFFAAIPRLKHLDLSSNRLIRLNKEVFATIGRAMETLILGDALASSVANLAEDVFEYLENLQRLDLSNNRLTNIPKNLLAPLANLESINLRDNALTGLPDGIFRGHVHSKLAHVKLSVNRIGGRLPMHTFAELDALRDVYLDENDVDSIDKGAFSNLKRLEYLDLGGNSIRSVEKSAFENLPTLGYLSLARNRLETFRLDAFDQVATFVSTMKVDVSENRLQHLVAVATNTSDQDQKSQGIFGESGIVNVKLLDLSGNNISLIDHGYFDPIKQSLMELRLSRNTITGNISKSTFGMMPNLRVLKLDHNRVDSLDADSLEMSPSLQSMTISHNRLTSLASKLFSRHADMRQLDLSENRITEIPEAFLSGMSRLERLTLAGNKIARFAVNVSSSLRHLDLSDNQLRYLSKEVGQLLAQLNVLNLANNELKSLENGAMTPPVSPSLVALDLSGNPLGNDVLKFLWTKPCAGIEELDLSNTSLKFMEPSKDLKARNIFKISLAHNGIESLNDDALLNLPELRHLDMSNNLLTTVPTRLWSTTPRLASLSLAFNPIRNVFNESFLGLNVLDEIRMQALHAAGAKVVVQSGIFLPLKNLRSLHVSPYIASGGFDLIRSTSVVDNLRNLHVYLDERADRKKFEFRSMAKDVPAAKSPLRSSAASFPSTLTSITIRGIDYGFRQEFTFRINSLEHLRNRKLRLTISNTTMTSIELGHLGAVRNLRLDVSYNNLVAIANPATVRHPGGRGVFLEQLELRGNRWQCNCDIGWVEHWMRQLRQATSAGHLREENGDNPSNYIECQQRLGVLRLAGCYNLGNKSLVDVFEEDLECGLVTTGGQTSLSSFNCALTIYSQIIILIFLGSIM